MKYTYKKKKTDLPKELKSVNVKYVEANCIRVYKDDTPMRIRERLIDNQRRGYKIDISQHHLDTTKFATNEYHLLWAVIENPKYSDIIPCIIDTSNNIYGMSWPIYLQKDKDKYSHTLEAFLEYCKDRNTISNTEDKDIDYKLNTFEPYEYSLTYCFVGEDRMPTYQGLWSKDVNIFTDYDEAAKYHRHINLNCEIKSCEGWINDNNIRIKKLGTLEDAIKKATKEWNEAYSNLVESNKSHEKRLNNLKNRLAKLNNETT